MMLASVLTMSTAETEHFDVSYCRTIANNLGVQLRPTVIHEDSLGAQKIATLRAI